MKINFNIKIIVHFRQFGEKNLYNASKEIQNHQNFLLLSQYQKVKLQVYIFERTQNYGCTNGSE